MVVNRGENWESPPSEEYCSWKGLRSCPVVLYAECATRQRATLTPSLTKMVTSGFCLLVGLFLNRIQFDDQCQKKKKQP